MARLRAELRSLKVGAALSLMFLLLRTMRYRGTVRLLGALAPAPRSGMPGPWARRIAWWVSSSQTHWYGRRFRCIHRALVIWWAMRWLGVQAEIVSGAAEDVEKGIHIHAWVESHEVPLGDTARNVARFTRLWPEIGAAAMAGGRRS